MRYVGLGTTHLLTGYEILLFLLGVIFFLTSARDIVKAISVFTLGQGITLISATFAGVAANAFLVDAVIALGICYKGFDNSGRFGNHLGLKPKSLLEMVFAFGLLHGFGLSARLQQLPLGPKGLEMMDRIVAFNVGVGLGQLAALSGMLILLSTWRRRPGFERFGRVANDGLGLCGLLLFVVRLRG